MMSDVKITGVDVLMAAMSKAITEDPPRIEDGLNECGDLVLAVSRRYVPVDTWDLYESGRKIVTGRGLGAEVSVEYGGPTAPYAIYVHENLFAQHAPGTYAKFLEMAVRETKSQREGIMQRALADQMGMKRGGRYVQ